MERITIFEIEKCTNGVLSKKLDLEFIDYISTNSKDIKENTLFIPLIGETLDGHDFINDAYENGCRNFLCDKNHSIDLEANVITVENTELALGDISKFYKEKFNIPFIAVTGSVGKTSTKDIISSVLKEKYNVLKNEGNFNNNIGVPQTLLNLNSNHDIAVIEMGMDKKGELTYLSNIVKPDIAVISNIGQSHIMNFEDGQDGIFKAKMEIANGLKDNGILLVNGDDKYLKTLKGKESKYKLITYGFENDNDIYIKEFEIFDTYSNFTCVYKEKEYNFDIKSVAKHNIFNALAAIVIGFEYGLTKNQIDDGFDTMTLSKNRLDIFDTHKYKIINDTYNASYDSIMSGLEVLNNFKGRKVAILGDVLELGSHSERIHRQIGKDLKCDLLITIGNDSKYINEETNIENYYFPTKEEFYKEANSLLEDGDVILVKASRGIKLDEVVEFLK